MDGFNTDDTHNEQTALEIRKERLDNALNLEDTKRHDEVKKQAGWLDQRKIRNAQTKGLILIYREKCRAIREGVKDYYAAQVNEQRVKNKHDLEQAMLLYQESLQNLQQSLSEKKLNSIVDSIDRLQETYLKGIDNVLSREDKLPKTVIERTLKRLDNSYNKIEEKLNDLEAFSVNSDELFK